MTLKFDSAKQATFCPCLGGASSVTFQEVPELECTVPVKLLYCVSFLSPCTATRLPTVIFVAPFFAVLGGVAKLKVVAVSGLLSVDF